MFRLSADCPSSLESCGVQVPPGEDLNERARQRAAALAAARPMRAAFAGAGAPPTAVSYGPLFLLSIWLHGT